MVLWEASALQRVTNAINSKTIVPTTLTVEPGRTICTPAVSTAKPL